MKITIKSPHIRVTKSLEEKITGKLEDLNGIYERIIACDIILTKEKAKEQNGYHVEAKLLMPKRLLFAQEVADHFSIALNGLFDKIEKQLVKHKEKLEAVG